jgi:hypothetical protein
MANPIALKSFYHIGGKRETAEGAKDTAEYTHRLSKTRDLVLTNQAIILSKHGPVCRHQTWSI